MDIFVPCSIGYKMCEIISNCKGYFYPNDGRLSVAFNYKDEILETITS